MMSNNMVKGLLKGLRYISQIFENDEKEPEFEIGNPTDVKHVAHIGCDGPAASPPSWMNDFKTARGGPSSASVNGNEERKGENPFTSISEDSSSKRGSRSRGMDSSEFVRTSRTGGDESPIKEKSNKPKQSKRSSRKDARLSQYKDQDQINNDSSSNIPSAADISKKTRRRKSKSGSNSKSSRAKAHISDSDFTSESGSVSKSFDSFDEDTENGFSHASKNG